MSGAQPKPVVATLQPEGGVAVVDGSTVGVELVPCPGGPILVRGADVVRDVDGIDHAVARPVVALCRCAKSQRKPWCDGTHKVIPPRPR